MTKQEETLEYDWQKVARVVDVYENAENIVDAVLLPVTHVLLETKRHEGAAGAADVADVLMRPARPFVFYLRLGPLARRYDQERWEDGPPMEEDAGQTVALADAELIKSLWYLFTHRGTAFQWPSWPKYMAHLERLVRAEQDRLSVADREAGIRSPKERALEQAIHRGRATTTVPLNFIGAVHGVAAHSRMTTYRIETPNIVVALVIATTCSVAQDIRVFRPFRHREEWSNKIYTAEVRTVLPGDGDRYVDVPSDHCINMHVLGQLPIWAGDRTYVGTFRETSTIQWWERKQPMLIVPLPLTFEPYNGRGHVKLAELINTIKTKLPKKERHGFADVMRKWLIAVANGYESYDPGEGIVQYSGDERWDDQQQRRLAEDTRPLDHRLPRLVCFHTAGPTDTSVALLNTALSSPGSGKAPPIKVYHLQSTALTPGATYTTKKRPLPSTPTVTEQPTKKARLVPEAAPAVKVPKGQTALTTFFTRPMQ